MTVADNAPSTIANFLLAGGLFALAALSCRGMENARQRKRRGRP